MAHMPTQHLACRSSYGLDIKVFGAKSGVVTDGFRHPPPSPTAYARACLFSSDGSLFVFADGETMCLIDAIAMKTLHVFNLPKACQFKFSPNNNFVCVFQIYSAQLHEKSGNVCVYRVSDGTLAMSYVQKKQQNWEPQWTIDEFLFAKLMASELQFHQNSSERYTQKLVLPKLSAFSLSSAVAPYQLAVHVAGSKGAPSFVRIYTYPNWSAESTPITSKSFFKADRVEMKWNQKATGLILLTSADVDQSGASYYGEQHIYLMLTNGESFKLPLAKPGPIYHFEWNPSSNVSEFCVVYGFMPAKATLFNLKGEATFDFGCGPRNEAHYNRFGTILALCGYGNLRGGMEFWSVADRKRICTLQAEDTTYFEWAPDGENFVTATTAPRLRVNNGFKIWDYTGAIKYEHKIVSEKGNEHELWEVAWAPPVRCSDIAEKPPAIRWKDVANAAPALAASAAKPAYVPPQLRAQGFTQPKFKLHDAENDSKSEADSNLSKTALKNKKKREAAKRTTEPISNVPVASAPPNSVKDSVSGDAEKDKKIKSLQKKIQQIASLKQALAQGKKLEVNQLDKIEKEAEVLAELEELCL